MSHWSRGHLYHFRLRHFGLRLPTYCQPSNEGQGDTDQMTLTTTSCMFVTLPLIRPRHDRSELFCLAAGMSFSFRERERNEVDMNLDHSCSAEASRGFAGILVSASEFSNHFIQSIRSVPKGTESRSRDTQTVSRAQE